MRHGQDRAGQGRHGGARGAGGGFTLIELLVVLGIIVLLVAVTLVVGSRVVGTGRERATLNAIQVLDQSVQAFIQARDGLPPAVYQYTPSGGGSPVLIPLADARVGTTEEMINSVGWYMRQAEVAPQAAGVFKGLDPKIVVGYDASVEGASFDQPLLTTVMDGWGNPIRYVHPTWQGVYPESRGLGQAGPAVDPETRFDRENFNLDAFDFAWSTIRRNFLTDADRKEIENNGQPYLRGDSDGGLCPGNTPYFYSAGPDGDPSTVETNVYATRPRNQTQQVN